MSCLGASSAFAVDFDNSLDFAGRYQFDWNGILIGTLVLGIKQDTLAYDVHLLVKSGGIVNLFTRHSSDTVASGAHAGTIYKPALYESHYKTKNKPRYIKLAFNRRGAVVKEIVEPPEDPNDRPAVPHAVKDSAFDPLTLLMAIRAGAKEARGFDAKRAYKVYAREQAPALVPIEGSKRAAIPYILSRTPLAGLTQKEAKSYAQGEPPLTLYFSDDARRIPLAVSVALFGSVHGRLVKECARFEACAD